MPSEPVVDQAPAIAPFDAGATDFPVRPLATCLVEQLEQAHRCPQHADPAPRSSSASTSTPTPNPSASLSTISGWTCPDVLSQPTIAQHGVDWNTLFPVEQRRKVFTGLPDCPPAVSGRESTSPPPTPSPIHLDLESDNIPEAGSFEVWLDIDSAGGIASNLAIAREGITWKAGRDVVSNLQSSLHLDPLPVRWYDPSSGRLRHQHRPVHRIPHLPFGELTGFREVELYLIFPRLYDPSREHWVITLEEYELWTNRIFLPSLEQVYPGATIQHLPSSAQHIRLNGTAAAVEGRARGVPDDTARYVQSFHYPLHAEQLAALWDSVQAYTIEAGLTQFQEASIVLTAKNLKLSTWGRTWAKMCDQFFWKWNCAINPQYLQQDFYDIAKEVVPVRPTDDSPDLALTLSWCCCCLEDFCCWFAQSPAASAGTTLSNKSPSPGGSDALELSSDSEDDPSVESSTEEEDEEEDEDEEPLVGAGHTWRQQFYPQSLTRDQGSITITPFRRSPLWK